MAYQDEPIKEEEALEDEEGDLDTDYEETEEENEEGAEEKF